MSLSGFYDIVRTEDLHISIPKTSHFSIGTSPYYAHQHGLAIDIYQDLTLKNYVVLSPVSGKILKIKPLIAPKPKFEGGIDKDYLILINNLSNSKLVWKLMHVKSFSNVGDQIKVGDPLGKTIRNGYFAYWSSPHVHLEVRSSEDAIRARGGKNFLLAFEKKENLKKNNLKLNYSKIPVKIISICPEFILAKLPEYHYHRIAPIYGFRAYLNQFNCILDGGIPQYKIGTVISNQNLSINSPHTVFLGKKRIGTLHDTNGRLGLFKFNSVKFSLNNKEIRGISLYLARFLPLIKIIPYKKNQFSFKPNSIQYMSIT